LIVNATCGVAFVVSVMMGQPLAALFAAETSAFSTDVMASSLFRSVCSQISMVWAVYLLGGSLARLVVLLRGSVDFYLTVHLLTGFPLAAAIMGWSMWYGARRLLGSTRSLT
jgi:ABC-type antimicrobial peptide transport system permease subunit